MRASQLRSAFARVRRYLSLTVSGCALGLVLSACGGDDETNRTVEAELPVKVSGADGASVSLRPMERTGANKQVTIRVARDGSGAPLLGSNYRPLGAVYQFTPLGWVEEEVEIRVPFLATESSTPSLLIAVPGGDWAEVVGARREGSFMVARVQRLGYATVAASTAGGRRAATLSARIRDLTGGGQPAAPLTLVAGASTSPAIPAAVDGALPVVITNTHLSLQLSYDLPACSVPAKVELVAANRPLNQEDWRFVNLGVREVTAGTGVTLYDMSLSASDNGTWVFIASSFCKEPGAWQASYSYVAYGVKFVANIANSTPTPAPTIVDAPHDIGVVEGAQANFSVTAQGDALAYEWQRSNDGGVTYAAAGGGNASSYGFVASLSDNNALFRARVSNVNGSTLSTPARLIVSARVVAPAVTTDPANQSVLDGETASFTVTGTGQPTPAIQWQQRVAANADAEAGWADITGATGSTYTTAPTAVAQGGAQYRALLSNAGGTASSLPATLVVNARVVAPAIVAGPQPISVTAGQLGALAVTASGTSPLSYQWFKDGQAIAGANASEVLVLADPADAGGSYAITVQVSNAAGVVLSAPATLSVVAVEPPVVTGTLIRAGEAGVVEASIDASLVVPAGALLSDTRVSIGLDPLLSVTLPEGFTPMSDAYDITPAGLAFAAPVVLNLPAPDTLPEGTVLALVELTSVNGPLRLGRAERLAASTNIRQLAMGQGAGGKRQISGIYDAANVLCATPQNSRGGAFAVGLSRAARYISAAVPASACQGVARAPSRALIPSTSTAPCTNEEFASIGAGSQATLVSRHVSCAESGTTGLSFTEIPSVAPNGQQRSYGAYTFEWRVGSDGPPRGLNKTYRLSFRLTQTAAGTAPSPLTLRLRPVFHCGAASDGERCSHNRPPTMSVTAGQGWTTPVGVLVNFDWNGGSNTWAEFTPQIQLWHALPGQDVNVERDPVTGVTDLSYFYLSGTAPTIRCDKGMSVNGGNGCVYANTPAVLVLSAADARVKEAAEHIRDVQRPVTEGGIGALGGLDMEPDGRATASSSKALQRSRITGLSRDNAANRNNACVYADSIIRQIPQASATCTAAGGNAACSCDEYPFNSTWNGAFLNRSGTSARYINNAHNVEAGSRLGRFYQAERVLDYTPDPGIGYLIGNEALSIPSRTGGDDFWVHIE